MKPSTTETQNASSVDRSGTLEHWKQDEKVIAAKRAVADTVRDYATALANDLDEVGKLAPTRRTQMIAALDALLEAVARAAVPLPSVSERATPSERPLLDSTGTKAEVVGVSGGDLDYLLAEEVIQRAVQGLDFAEDAITIILPVKRCEQEGEQMVAYIDGPTLESLLCENIDRYTLVPQPPAPAETQEPVADAEKLLSTEERDWIVEHCLDFAKPKDGKMTVLADTALCVLRYEATLRALESKAHPLAEPPSSLRKPVSREALAEFDEVIAEVEGSVRFRRQEQKVGALPAFHGKDPISKKRIDVDADPNYGERHRRIGDKEEKRLVHLRQIRAVLDSVSPAEPSPDSKTQ